jgi:hypothetical protein
MKKLVILTLVSIFLLGIVSANVIYNKDIPSIAYITNSKDINATAYIFEIPTNTIYVQGTGGGLVYVNKTIYVKENTTCSSCNLTKNNSTGIPKNNNSNIYLGIIIGLIPSLLILFLFRKRKPKLPPLPT